MAPNVGMYSATHESVTVGRDRKILTGKEPIRLQNSLPCPLEKKEKTFISGGLSNT